MSTRHGAITRKGQVTLPADFRRALDLHEGDAVSFRLEDGEVRVPRSTSTLADGYQSIGPLDVPRTDAEIAAIIHEERAQRSANTCHD